MVTLEQITQKYGELISLIDNNSNSRELSCIISKVSPPNAPEEDSIVFVSDKKYLPDLLLTPPAAIVIPTQALEIIKPVLEAFNNTHVLHTKDPRSAMALIHKAEFNPGYLTKNTINQNNFIAPEARVSDTVKVGAFSFIGPDVTIGANTIIGSNVTIEGPATIGESCEIHAHSYVGPNTEIGNYVVLHPQSAVGTSGFGYAPSADKTSIHPIPHIGKTVIEDYVHIGAGSKVDRGTFGETKIGKHTKLDNLCHIAHNCEVGAYSMLAGGFMMAGSTKIGDHFIAGGRTSVIGHIEVADNVTVGGLSGISKSITKPGAYSGYPLLPVKEDMKNRASFTKLYELRKKVTLLEKKLEQTITELTNK